MSEGASAVNDETRRRSTAALMSTVPGRRIDHVRHVLPAMSLIGLVLTGGGHGVSIGAFHAAAMPAGGVAVIAGMAGWFPAPRGQA